MQYTGTVCLAELINEENRVSYQSINVATMSGQKNVVIRIILLHNLGAAIARVRTSRAI
jgi:hypothetical protein